MLPNYNCPSVFLLQV